MLKEMDIEIPNIADEQQEADSSDDDDDDIQEVAMIDSDDNEEDDHNDPIVSITILILHKLKIAQFRTLSRRT